MGLNLMTSTSPHHSSVLNEAVMRSRSLAGPEMEAGVLVSHQILSRNSLRGRTLRHIFAA